MFNFTIEVGGKPVAVIAETDQIMLDVFLQGDTAEGKDFRHDMVILEVDGEPLWDCVAPITARLSNPHERGDFEASLGLSVGAGIVQSSDEDSFIHWLGPVCRGGKLKIKRPK